MRTTWLMGVLLAGGLVAFPPLVHASRCNQVSVVSDTSTTGSDALSDLSDLPARICSVEFIANAANGWAAVFDSPSDSETHAQAVVKSEPGAATALNSDWRYYGEEGRPTQFGLDVRVVNGVAIISWAGASP